MDGPDHDYGHDHGSCDNGYYKVDNPEDINIGCQIAHIYRWLDVGRDDDILMQTKATFGLLGILRNHLDAKYCQKLFLKPFLTFFFKRDQSNDLSRNTRLRENSDSSDWLEGLASRWSSNSSILSVPPVELMVSTFQAVICVGHMA